ncbi:PepSY-associated TM helix domain-containing protein [Pontibacter virosus]|uniref:PepSY-associated transmembrane protein n=1 Tax=Pontibacter virosus TaxID=1765052 RepID=A0A2U1B2Q4_9BACT|nr:PepSY-associated TM helix domain-containing protein [Pontibacter virosus]PVY42959.1 PepSY-associated transmembrane protein [Pontibacter virosus]
MSTSTATLVKQKVRTLADRLRNFRVYHRYLGLFLGMFILISSVTGILLGWKKDVDLLQPPTQKGVTTDLQQWLPLAELSARSLAGLDSAQGINNNPIDRIEARLDKGIVKTIFTDGSWEVQLDASTGKVLSVARRHSDWIEKIHDGSIISDLFKLISMNVLGLGLLILSVTGFFLWFYPKQIRKIKS